MTVRSSTADTPVDFSVIFFLGSKMLGEATWGMQRSREDLHTPYSNAYLCPICGDVWARVAVNHPNSRWFAVHRHCRKHQHLNAEKTFNPGGVFYSTLLSGDMPTQVWAEDFIFLMRVKGY